MKLTFRKIVLKKHLLLTVIIGASGLLSSCYYDKEEILYPGSTTVDCTTTPAGFAADVQPLFISKCAVSGCHDPATASGSAIFQNYSQISSKKDRILIRAVIDKTMPPTGPLTPAESAKIKCWIEAGALDN